jgi:hypothetical protein
MITALDLGKKGTDMISTGIAELDALLRGGFPCGNIRFPLLLVCHHALLPGIVLSSAS